MKEITERLFGFAEKDFKEFTKKLVPDTKYEILGIRTDCIEKIAKEISKNTEKAKIFLKEKHFYYEEFLLHGFILIYLYKDFTDLVPELDYYLQFIDNWAICDMVAARLKSIKKSKEKGYKFAIDLLKSPHVYSVRFGIVLLKCYFLGENFKEETLLKLSEINSDEYYVNMAIAWFLSEALIKNYEQTIIYLKKSYFPPFVHNKAIQKCTESYRIKNEIKAFLRTLKV